MRAHSAAPLGADFWKLWTSSAVANLGDGVTMVAGPLLVASIDTNPAAVAGAVFAQQLPWLLFALISGAWADRLDRRRLVVTANLIRAAALIALTVLVLTDTVTVWSIYAVFFTLGTCETVADSAAAAFVPAIVAPAGRPRANALMYATFNVVNQFAAKPVGAWLFVIAAAVPFGVNALTFAVSAAVIASIRTIPPTSLTRPAGDPSAGDPSAVDSPAGDPSRLESARLRTEIAEGIRWLYRHRLLRTLAVTMAVGNLVFCAAFAIFVLYARERLGLSDLGYGVLLIAFAVGGPLGTVIAPGLLARFSAAVLLRCGLLVEVALHATLAMTRSPCVAALMIIVFGIHTSVWGIVVTTIRQRDVPPAMYGRVTSVYTVTDLSGAALGALLGGAVAATYGLVATYWTAAAAMAVVATAAWRPIRSATTPNRPFRPSRAPVHPVAVTRRGGPLASRLSPRQSPCASGRPGLARPGPGEFARA
ncbi:MFS transporter [Micromonosporaceae bacterium Da 78-11]